MKWISVKDDHPDSGEKVLVVYQYDGEPMYDLAEYYGKQDTVYEEAFIKRKLKETEEFAGRPLTAKEKLLISLFDERTIEDSGFYFYELNGDGYYEYKTYPQHEITHWAKLVPPIDYGCNF